MEHRIPAQDVRTYRRTMRALQRSAERTAPELFRWLGWSTAVAAIQVVAVRTGSIWLKAVPVILALFISGRIQWFLGLKHPEVRQPDGSLVIRFQRWRLLLIPLAWLVTWAVAVGMADLIAKSDLLPPTRGSEPARTAVAHAPEAEKTKPR